MKECKNILSAVLICLFVFQVLVGAEEKSADDMLVDDAFVDEMLGDLDYIDDIFKYDLYQFNEQSEEGEQKEVISNKRAAHTVLSLGIMEPLVDGSFGENDTVPYNEFAKIILNLSAGESQTIAALYDLYGETRPTTQGDAAKYLVGALGYQAHEYKYPGENPSVFMASQLGLFSGVELNPAQHITRGELAQMIYTALKVDMLEQVTFGESPTYRVTKGKTILSERFCAVEVTGVLTAVPGVNIYSTSVPRKNEVEIDRALYQTDDTDYSSMLAHRIFGYAKQEEDGGEYRLLGIIPDERDEALTISLSNLSNISENKLTFMEDGRESKVSVNDIRNVLYNGNPEGNYQFTDELMGYEGKIVLGKSARGGSYDIAVVIAISSLWVERVTTMDKNIYFKDGLTYEGLPYISAEPDSKRSVTVKKGGETITVEEIKPLDVISVIQSAGKNYLHIEVSNAFAEGSVTEISDDQIAVSGVFYPISMKYLAAIKEAEKNKEAAEVHIFKIGDQGVFYLSAGGYITGYRGESGILYGLMTEMDQGKGIEPRCAVRFFNQNKEWLTCYLAEKMTLDGEINVSQQSAYESLNKAKDTVFYEPIRYKLNAKDEIIFLDTMIQNNAEKLDDRRMIKSDTWKGKLDWTFGYNLPPTSYSITNKTVIFFLPGDLEDETEYRIISNTALALNQNVNLGLYSADDFYKTAVATYKGSISNVFYGTKVFAVSRVAKAIDKNGDERYKLIGKKAVSTSPGVGSWDPLEFYVDDKLYKDLLEKNESISTGDMFFFILNGKEELSELEFLITKGKLYPGKDTSEIRSSDLEYAYGTITDIDFDEHLVKIEIGDETTANKTTRVFMLRGIQVWDGKRQDFITIKINDLNIGDSVLVTGNVRHACLTAFRN